MGERELMKLRELKEAAHALFARGRYAQCAETYARILRLAPKDPNVRVRHAESCRRAGDRQSAVASYRAAAALLMEQGCESRARGALRAALELDPKDPTIHADLARLGQQAAPSTTLEDERLYTAGATGFFQRQDAAADAGARGNLGQAPPPPPPPYVLLAAEETPVPRPLPPVPAIAPVRVEALQRAAGRPASTLAPIPLIHAIGPARPGQQVPSPLPVVQGRLITQAPVPPPSARGPGASPVVSVAGSGVPAAAVPHPGRPAGAVGAPASNRPAGATMAPLPRAGVASGQGGDAHSALLTMVPMPQGGAASGVGGSARAAGAPPAQVMPYRPEMRRLGPNAVALRVSPHARWVIIRSDSPLEVSRAETLPATLEQQPRGPFAPEPRTENPASTRH
ncbi:tetratricopeptide repeat protein [Pyxidicoccus xibeiensis]|uniref:tetratricopeptide repeat protein n=1 Tax=Pyxidicoccus xibeiensis TaxID=2906759 RepID=UPI0020A7C497|nr:hypothetical protein [Pyxidicoccus xibeiensis]MCP3137020.1 hypothetical protein [Pyxidicoccus xibeiensis]